MTEPMNILKIGFENFVTLKRIVAIVNPSSAPVKRMIKQAREAGKLIDATSGKPTRSAILADSEHIILSSISPGKLGERMEREE